MKNVRWVIEDYHDDNGTNLLADEVKKLGFECEVIKYEPFESGNYNIYDNVDAPIVFQGSINLARQMQRQKSWIPGPWLSYDNYLCSKYYAHWGKYILNKEYIMMPLQELHRRSSSLFKEFGDFFVRPDSGFKTFAGQVVKEDTFESDWRRLNFYEPSKESLVVVSPLQHIEKEWRFIVVNKKVVTGSLYKSNGQKKFEPYRNLVAFELAQEIALGDFQPDTAYTLDIAETTQGNYALVEANSFSCAGLYRCDMTSIVENISSAAYQEWLDHH